MLEKCFVLFLWLPVCVFFYAKQVPDASLSVDAPSVDVKKPKNMFDGKNKKPPRKSGKVKKPLKCGKSRKPFIKSGNVRFCLLSTVGFSAGDHRFN